MSPIGVFDSGVGGLTVVKELIRQLPYEDIVYFGDTARVPYGIKSKETVIRFSIENILFLLKYDVKLICIACNTVSSLALPEIKNHFRVPIIGVISPGAREAVIATKNKRIGVIGTKGTIKSRAYEDEIKQLDTKVKITAVACPLFVPFVEEGWLNGDVVLTVAKHYLKPLKDAGVDTLILGCTHYPLLKKVISGVMGKNVILIDSAKQVAMEVNKILAADGLLNSKGKGRHEFFVSDNPEWFKNLAGRFLGRPAKNVKKVNEAQTYGTK
ncbi:MAG: glutamate racemase [Candidatus Omnitrophica bacterium CG08_land_8_20_14_0_20_41_16]|uniref:Glutamate racemase n=1 Tax=Candidatus Sherwoodlollariibacterium unditelluris TaxID=1974757 RepID=A0A2G9YK76_9BACT|nr:MAG: glutamate racemase [Candidatus Omnitrophica bacterium CG23_combo_of_CG06-09_8_20_14_all_41_10]PIS33305.1 MAG: glutamate racemase [Candidatus Omnitrophica bacterium CG08_land_8_20_14_0_20_41_16]